MNRNLKEVAEFFLGQHVRSRQRGKKAGRLGIVTKIEDLSYVIPNDDPNGTRSFFLVVKTEQKTSETGNGCYWEPADPDEPRPVKTPKVREPKPIKAPKEAPKPAFDPEDRKRRDVIVPLVSAAIEKAGGSPSDLGSLLDVTGSLVKKWKQGLLYALPDDAMVERIKAFLDKPAEIEQPVIEQAKVRAAPPEPVAAPERDPEREAIKKRLMERIQWWKNHGG